MIVVSAIVLAMFLAPTITVGAATPTEALAEAASGKSASEAAGPPAGRYEQAALLTVPGGERAGFQVALSGPRAFVNGTIQWWFERNAGGADGWGFGGEFVSGKYAVDRDAFALGFAAQSGPHNPRGDVYLRERNAGGMDNWGARAHLEPDMYFFNWGRFLDISDDTLIVGSADRRAEIYEYGEDRFVVLDAPENATSFGNAVAIDGDTAVVVGLRSAGDAYVFRRNAGGAFAWGPVARLEAGSLLPLDYVGSSVAVRGDLAVVGTVVFERNAGGADTWGRVAGLAVDDPETSSFLGSTVLIHEDTIYISDRDAGAGAGYLFFRNVGGPDNWGLLAKFTAPDGEPGNEFGVPVDASAGRFIIGAQYSDTLYADSGSAHVFEERVCAWVEAIEPQPVDVGPGSLFGSSVAQSEDRMVVGAIGDGVAGPFSGAAYVLERNVGGGDRWGRLAKLIAADGAPEDRFGASVSIDGSHVVIGAPLSDDTQVGDSVGAAYVFERNVGGADAWGQVVKLTAEDRADGDRFGGSVAIRGDWAVVGAWRDDDAGDDSGAAYVFKRNADGADAWGQVTKLTADDAGAGDRFGGVVAIDGNRIVVGASGDDDGGLDAGAVYLFERDPFGARTWGQAMKIVAPEALAGAGFGASVALLNDRVVVGAPDDDEAGAGSGAAHVFERNIGGADQWGQAAKITAADPAPGDRFGGDVSISRETVVVGANFDDDAGDFSGAVYVFDRNTGGAEAWGEVDKLTAADAAASDQFGVAVSIEGNKLVVGALFHSDGGEATGAAYVYYRSCAECGDGFFESLEECDDGNVAAGDGCSPACEGEPCIDGDSDGFGLFGSPDCVSGPFPDCDDEEDSIFPGAPDVCDLQNNDCNHPTWPGLAGTNETDEDLDGFTECAGDCDDTSASTYPAGPPVCDDANNDCSDPAWPALTPDEFDEDGDGVTVCGGDCDDTSGTVYPGAEDICDGLNNDCAEPTWPTPLPDDIDADHDLVCALLDCDDSDPTTNPFAPEVCDGVDNNCDGHVDGPDDDIDRVPNTCDNCLESYNPDQRDRDGDLEGDACDLDDSVLFSYLRFRWVNEYLWWQFELWPTSWNLYRGDLAILKANGSYTQVQDGNPLALQLCGRNDSDPGFFDTFTPPPGEAVFYLATWIIDGIEGDLGVNSASEPRPNDHPCP